MKLQMLKRTLAFVLAGILCACVTVEAKDTLGTAGDAVGMQETTIEADEEEPAEADARTKELEEIYLEYLSAFRTQAIGSYETELAKFPASYQVHLKKLHKNHPNWIFVAVNSKLKWDDVVAAERVSGASKGKNQSLLPKNSAGLFLSKSGTDYSISKGAYIPKDGSTWVSASSPAVANFTDPRSYLTENYIFAFEALTYNEQYHTEKAVEKALNGTDLYKYKGSYTNTKGKKVDNAMTYGQMILAAGMKNKVSPLFLAAKIRQETGAKLTNGSISGNFSYGGKSYRGYYNFYNIGATSTSTGSAVANGLTYAMGGSSKSKSYGRPWTSPVLSIDGGAQFLASSYIGRGQNTIYLQRFNVAYAPYYEHQYMQNLTGAASEAMTTYNSYNKMGIVNDAYVFYIPVYQQMPEQTNTVKIEKKGSTGKTTTTVSLRNGPSGGYASLEKIPSGKTVTVLETVYTDMEISVTGQEQHPYWYKVKYGSKTGYVSYKYIKLSSDGTIPIKGTRQLKVTATGKEEKIYYETSDPAVATVNGSGKITGVKKGTCEIYAVTSSGKRMDAVGITVSSSTAVPTAPAAKPAKTKLSSLKNSASGTVLKWQKTERADGYYIYRKKSGKYKKIKTITSGTTVKYTDKKAPSGKLCTYTVKAYNKVGVGSYDKTGLTIRRLKNPKLISATGTTDGITVKWGKVKSAVEYEVYRKTEDSSYEKIAKLDRPKKLSYKDKTAEKDTVYYYTVRACSGKYKGAYTSAGLKGTRK